MLNAQNKEKLAPTVSPGSEAVESSFGTVISSVQGLQQRLEDFSVDEISEAEALARTHISRLIELAKKLDRLTEIQRSVADARRSATQGGIETIEIPDLKVLENLLPVHAVVQAGNLIPFPRPKKALSEIGEDSLPTAAPIICQPESSKSEADGSADNRDTTNDFGLDQAQNLEEAVVPGVTSGQMFATDAEGTETPIVPAAMPYDSTIPQEDFPSHVSGEELASSEISRILAQDFTQLPENEATELLANAPTFEFAKNEESAAEAKGEKAAGEAFDQRLLDDLIKNYGEFVASPATSTPVEPPTTPSRPAHPPAVRRELRMHEPESPEQSVPNVRKNGQLDRELKKIIKDYGEVDLYSRQSPINLKTAGIAAFLLLGALVAGFYFFYSPNAPSVGDAPGAPPTAAQSQIESGSPTESTGKRDKGSVDRNGTAGESDRNIGPGKSQ